MTIRFVLLALCLTCCFAQEASISGKWSYTMETPNGAVPVHLDLKVDGERLTGTIATGDRSFPIENGSVSGSTLKFTFKRVRPQGGTMTYSVSATVSGNGMKGATTTEVDGQNVTQDWEAKRE